MIKRWQTRGNKYWLELYRDENGYSYKGDGCCGNLGDITLDEALARMQWKLDAALAWDGINMKEVQ